LSKGACRNDHRQQVRCLSGKRPDEMVALFESDQRSGVEDAIS
jgi:hypothetical protein